MKILGVGAHYDDIEINCAGTFLKAKDRGDELYLITCSDSSKSGGMKNRKDEQDKASKMMTYNGTFDLHLQDGYLMHNYTLVSKLQEAIKGINPDFVFCPSENDIHQDHSAVGKAITSVNRFSDFSVINFPSQDPKEFFIPNLYVDISKYFKKKLQILKQYKSQTDKPWIQRNAIEARSLGIGGAKYTEKFKIKFMKI